VKFAKIHSAQTNILSADKIDVEVDVSNGLNSFNIIGLPGKSIEESRDRVASAIKNSKFTSPKQKNQKTVVSLTPASLKKDGVNFDLAIALGYLQAVGDIKFNADDKVFIGELSLDGKLKKCNGVLTSIKFAKESGFREIYIPKENELEGRLIDGIDVYCADNLIEMIDHLSGKNILKKIKFDVNFFNKNLDSLLMNKDYILPQIKGCEFAKRALLIAAAGGHNICFYGPPGTGKTLLAKSLSEILPPLNHDRVLETSSIHSEIVLTPPIISPHHTSSHTSIIGGGSQLQAGEITMAHNGVLFMDEFPEFDRRTIESLRQPIEDGFIKISRKSGSAKMPADFILVASMNPCPCGFFGTENKKRKCTCTPKSIDRYRSKISGPILDRIDLWVNVSEIEYSDLHSKSDNDDEKVQSLKKQVVLAREVQKDRFKNDLKIQINAKMQNKDVLEFCHVTPSIKNTLDVAAEKLNLSIRSYYKIIKIARTIADLDGSEKIKRPHVLEALQYRSRNIY
jgi:magnesium chelatase family protein